MCQGNSRLAGFVAGVAGGGIPASWIEDDAYRAGYADGVRTREQYEVLLGSRVELPGDAICPRTTPDNYPEG